jgi:hypothetical protein
MVLLSWVFIQFYEMVILYKVCILCLYSSCVSITNVFPLSTFVIISLFVSILFFIFIICFHSSLYVLSFSLLFLLMSFISSRLHACNNSVHLRISRLLIAVLASRANVLIHVYSVNYISILYFRAEFHHV